MNDDARALLQRAREVAKEAYLGAGLPEHRDLMDEIDAYFSRASAEPQAGEQFCYALTLNGALCEGDNVVSTEAESLQVDCYQDYAADDEKYAVIPLYTTPPARPVEATAQAAEPTVDAEALAVLLKLDEAGNEGLDLSPGDHLCAWAAVVIRRLLAASAPATPEVQADARRICHWGADDPTYTTACGESFYPSPDSDDPQEWMKFCCFCGGKIEYDTDNDAATPPAEREGK